MYFGHDIAVHRFYNQHLAFLNMKYEEQRTRAPKITYIAEIEINAANIFCFLLLM